MTIVDEPLFLKNKSWYKYDDELFKYVLSEEGKKNPEVVKSYNDFYETLERKENE